MMGAQCGTCRAFSPSTGWLVLARQSEPSFMSSMLGGSSGGAELVDTFCSLRCVAEYAYVKAVAEAAGTDSP